MGLVVAWLCVVKHCTTHIGLTLHVVCCNIVVLFSNVPAYFLVTCVRSFHVCVMQMSALLMVCSVPLLDSALSSLLAMSPPATLEVSPKNCCSGDIAAFCRASARLTIINCMRGPEIFSNDLLVNLVIVQASVHSHTLNKHVLCFSSTKTLLSAASV